MKQILTILFLLSLAFTYAVTINVSAGESIQNAINNAANGDIVLVGEGTYVENINFNGKLITVASWFLTTQDPTYISSTIIDGNDIGKVVIFENSEDSTAILCGFTIINGLASGSIPQNCGGGIYCDGSSPSIQNVSISGNSAVYGGGIYCESYSSPSFDNVTITDNSASSGGGGIYCNNYSNPSLDNLIITGNSAYYGGGFYCNNYSSPSLQNVTITGNSATGTHSFGGGIYCCFDSDLILENVTISGNSANDGGGIFCYSSSPNLQNVTIANNDAVLGKAIYSDGSSLSLINSILWNNEIFNISGDVTATYSDIEGGWLGDGNILSDPLFVDPTNGDYHLQPNSPCIDAGDPSSPLDPDGTIVDMGAYYFHQYFGPTWYISTTGSDVTGNGSEQLPFATIQLGINCSSDTDIVLVQPGTYVENINFNGKPITVASLFYTTQDETYISSTIIDGNSSGSVVTFDHGENSSAVLCGFTITNGYGIRGGGIYCYISNPILQNVKILDNTASAYGGGICCELYSYPSLQNVTISNNSAYHFGGGIYCSTGSSPSLNNVTISGNSAFQDGGGFYCDDSSPSLENVAITSNYGGGIYCYGSSSILQNVTISGNSGGLFCGGIYCYGSNLSLANSILWNNTSQEIYIQSGSVTATYSDIEGGWAGTGNINLDPLFVDPGNGDYHLQSTSLCIDYGDPDTDISDYETDLDGNPRIRNVIIDMGVYEYQDGGITVQNTIPADDNQAYEFTDTGTTIQFSGTHPVTTINATKHNTDPGVYGSLPAGIENISTDRYWNIYSTDGNVGVYDVTFDLSGVSGIQNFNTLHILKRDNSSSDWQDVVTDLGSTLTYNEPSITVIGLTSFSDFGIGGGSDNPLPVYLSSFYALYISGIPTLYWTTQSETENAYWNVYRGTSDSFTEAMWLNANDPVPGNGTTNTPSDYIYLDNASVMQNLTYWYWIEDVSLDGETFVHDPITLEIPFEDTPIIPDTYGLHQNYPNPFNPSTSISFALEEESDVEVIVYNIKGEKIKTIFNDHVYEDQTTTSVWDGKDGSGKQVSSGIYFYKLQTQTVTQTRKMLLLK